MNRYLSGAIAGLVATGVMTVVIVAAEWMGLLRVPPPEQVTARTAERAGVDRHGTQPRFTAISLASHHAYGASCGVLYALVRRFLPAPGTAAGLLYGALLWTVAYLGYLPVLRLYPWPKDDRRSRAVTMVAAHAVYGVTLDRALRRLSAATTR